MDIKELYLEQNISFDLEKIKKLATKYQIKEVTLFGSVLRDDFNDESDIDIMVSYSNPLSIGWSELYQIEEEFKKIFNRSVDVVSKKAIEESDNYLRRQNILENTYNIYCEEK